MTTTAALRIRLLAPTALLAGGAVGLTEAVAHGEHGPAALVATARSATVLGPSALLGLLVAAALVVRIARRSGATPTEGSAAWVLGATAAVTVTAAAASGVHGLLVGTGHHAVPAIEHALRDGGAVAPAALAVALATTLAGIDPTRADAAATMTARYRALGGLLTGAALRRAVGAAALSVAVLGTITLAPVGERAAGAQTAAGPVTCDASTTDRSYDVVAINVDIPMNRWGDHDENGMVFALADDAAAITNWSLPLNSDPAKDPAGNRRLRPRPLVLRGNVGECLAVTFTNSLDMVQGDRIPNDPRLAVQPFGVAYDARTSGPGAVGHNADRNLRIGQTTTQYWQLPAVESTHLFRDIAVAAGSEADGGSAVHGLYGAVVAEPAGSRWLDPISGDDLYTGTGSQSGELYLQATIVPPTGNPFREAVMLGQDELPHSMGFGFNYGAEQGDRRELYRCPDCLGEETSLSSWPYGDPALVKLASGPGPWAPPGKDLIYFSPPVEPLVEPAAAAGTAPTVKGGTVVGPEPTEAGFEPPAGEPNTDVIVTGRRPNPLKKGDSQENCGLTSVSCWTSNVVHTYRGDPTKIRFGMAGAYETHVFHLHAHQWLADPLDVGAAGTNPTRPSPTRKAASPAIDSQTFGPWEAFTADLLFGSGSQPGTVGDSIFHCHLYPHFAAGFWALLRTHDVLEDGTGESPDRIRVNALQVMPKLPAPPVPTADNPGYPRFIPGTTGWRAPQPPFGVSKDGKWAPRVVAGRALTPADTRVERGVQNRFYGGAAPKPGAPFTDPCPKGSREVDYHVTAIQLDVVYNKQGWHDTQGRVLVPSSDVAAIRAGRKKPEPLFFRVNAGDCINFSLTNDLPTFFGNDVFVKLVQTNMIGQHIHLVKFDVQASDGSSNGWNYQQAAFTGRQDAFSRAVAAGTQPCDEQVGCAIPTPAAWDPTNPPNNEHGQTIHERWYADDELHTVFTHDHHFAAVAQQRGHYGALVVEPAKFDVRQPVTGRYLQPLNTAGRGTVCTTRCTGTAFGAQADLVGPAAKDDFREFSLAFADYISLTRPGGNSGTKAGTVNPPGHPEAVPKEDPGVRAINLRSAPLSERVHLNGTRVDPAYAFSSHVWGDPDTPLLQAYSGDNVRFRLIQGSQEEQHAFTIHGQRWRKEIEDPTSPLVNSQPLGISEAFNVDIRNIGCGPTRPRCSADFLWGGTDTQDLTQGAWGILRVHDGKVPGLLPLPDNVPSTNRTAPVPTAATRTAPPRAAQGVCPAKVPVRHYDVVAVRTDATYDPQGSHDPYALAFTTPQLAPIVKAGGRVEPLVLRAAEGECVEVTLTNQIDAGFLAHTGEADGDATIYEDAQLALAAGLRVSLHPQLVSYDVTRGDGAAVGFNGDQSVAPGERFTYRWYADNVTNGELGASTLSSLGDIGGHRHHGLLAGLVVEPRGSTWHDPRTGVAGTTRPSADVRVPGAKDFREHVVMYQDALNLRDAGGRPFPDAYSRDSEDRGEVGINYARAGFPQRLDTWEIDRTTPDADAIAGVFSSVRHGDPWTPLIEAETGDQLRVRVLQTADRSRHHAFAMTGHGWFTSPGNSRSRYTGVQGGMTVLGAINVETVAGGGVDAAGDYLYGDFFGKQNLSGGSWGLLRVHPRGTSTLRPLDVDVP